MRGCCAKTASRKSRYVRQVYENVDRVALIVSAKPASTSRPRRATRQRASAPAREIIHVSPVQ